MRLIEGTERMKKFSIYPNWETRIALHAALWVIVFCFFISISRSLFGPVIFAASNMLYGIIVLLITMGNHYFLSYTVLPLMIKRKWLSVLFCFLLVYIFSAISTVFPLHWMAQHFKENPFLEIQSERHAVLKFWDIFSYGVFSWVYTVIFFNNLVAFALKFAKNYYEENKEKIEIMRERNSMELNFLRSQIQPHFLFNTLNNIYGLVIDNEKASESILKLSDLLRFSLYESSKGSITLKDEVKFLSDYITLEQMRHKESKVDIEYDFNEIEHPSLEIASLLLVNFVENAFKHGVNANIHNSWVRMVLKETQSLVTFTITNNIGKKVKEKVRTKASGLGLYNVRRRLDLEYTDKYDLSIRETAELYEVVLTLKAGIV